MRLFAIIFALYHLPYRMQQYGEFYKNAGVNTSLKYEKAPVIMADTEVYNVMILGQLVMGKV